MSPKPGQPLGSPQFIDAMDYTPAWWLGALHPWCRNPDHPSKRAPCLLVVHSGDHRAALAEYMLDPTDKPHAKGAVFCHDGKWRRQVATHAAWHAGKGRLVQCLPLTLEGWGTGSAKWRGVVAQRIAWHVELAGPPTLKRGAVEVAQLQDFARELVKRGCTHWTRHSDLDKGKRDPGPGLAEDWAVGILERG